MTMPPAEGAFNHIVAVEVAKDHLVIHTLPDDRQIRIANTAKAISRLLEAEMKHNAKRRLGALLVICEATGGYERHVLETSSALQLVQPASNRTRSSCTRRLESINFSAFNRCRIKRRLI
jgi:transposase